MHRSDYTQEVGLKTTGRTVSKPVAVAIIALAATGVWLGGRQVHTRSETPPAPDQPAAGSAEAPVARR